ncbi:hypothetical protein, variant 3 [Batrachochytrium dendrobatidis JEL423]|uniref:Uncharacterized protein n=1 Tax=Batrachochytrium dendrobatidis (strain JEL423) TaxID=403673 RepID=A0A177W7L9_BATDL|nr:hypothetical protein, variant 3 [Batrachochytrium dendrobatidis JEL423]
MASKKYLNVWVFLAKTKAYLSLLYDIFGSIIEENQERRLELNSLMIPLLDLLPLTSTSVVVSSKFIDVILAFLYRFQPDIRQSAVKFASAILGVCHAFEDMKLSFIQIKMLEQLAFGTNTFLRRKLVSSTSRLLANAI